VDDRRRASVKEFWRARASAIESVSEILGVRDSASQRAGEQVRRTSGKHEQVLVSVSEFECMPTGGQASESECR